MIRKFKRWAAEKTAKWAGYKIQPILPIIKSEFFQTSHPVVIFRAQVPMTHNEKYAEEVAARKIFDEICYQKLVKFSTLPSFGNDKIIEAELYVVNRNQGNTLRA